MTEPTVQDFENARRRQAISDKFRQQSLDALVLAEQVLGPGWRPSGFHTLIEKVEEDRARKANDKPIASAKVITCQNECGDKRHFRVETMQECETPEAGFGEMLLEPDPNKTVTWAGKTVYLHRYSLCWGWYEKDYRPASAEALAAARERRQEKAVEREAEGNLFADLIREEGYVPPKRKGPRR